ncbi:MAG TPA: hypothetical protein VMD99_18105 [Terriglobales bacterium]|nr:hypothetical protein [Terriglobales bacterium]
MQPPAPTARELAMVVFRQRRVFLSAAGLVLVAAVLYAAAGARYRADMKILVRPGREDAPVSAEENAPIDLTRLAITEEDLNSEVELVRDDEVMRETVEETGLGGRDWFHFLHPGEGHAERVERAARRLAKKLQVEAVKKTNLITISYASDDPQHAANVLQAVANAYLEKHTIVHRPNGQVDFFQRETKDSRRRLEQAELKLLDFTLLHSVVEAAQERDMALQKLSDVDASYRQTNIDLAETGQRVRVLQAQLATLPERTTTQIRTADNPELLKELKSSLLDLQLKKIQLLTKFEPNHRLVQEVEKQIAEARAAIAAESVLPVRDETTDKNPNYEWAKAELQKAQVQLKGLEARAAATGEQETAYRTMAQKLGADAITQDDLASAEKAAQDNYLLYIKKQEEARMADALDEHGIVNVAIAQQPVAPALPVWSTWAVLALGMVVAGATGTGAAFAADYVDSGLRTPEDVMACLNAPVLASLPRSTRGRLSA